MRPFNRKKLFLIPFAVAAFIAAAGFAVMLLWNALLPVIFHVAAITFWQALGIFVLCKILFGFGKGGPGRFGGRGPWMRRRWEERMKNMTPEEREAFRKKWEEKCGHWRDHNHGHDFGPGWDRKAPEGEQV